MAIVQLSTLFSGETGGGTFTLTNISNVVYPTTITDGNFGDITLNSAADLPYVFTNGYFALFGYDINARGGVYDIEYCVSGCNGLSCSTTNITMVEDFIASGTPNVERCGVNGVYGSVTACYLGAVTNVYDGLPYSGTLSTLTWISYVTGLVIGTGPCITIPNTVPAGTVGILIGPTQGGCAIETITFELINKNIYAGTNASKKLCLDKHQIEVYKNTVGGSGTGLVNLRTELGLTGGEIVPSGALRTYSFVSGPSTILLTNTEVADFRNAVPGIYTFTKTISYGSCTSTATYTVEVVYCTVGDQVTKIKTACKLNTNITMNTAYAALFNSAYNPISTAGCWELVNATTQLDLEINGTPYIDYQLGDKFPYNAVIKITSSGVYDFEFGESGGGSNPGGCVGFTIESECGGCDWFESYNEAGTFVIDTTSGAPCLGVGRTYFMGCGTRQISLYAKYNQLNAPPAIPISGCDGPIASGGTWTLDFVSGSPGLPFTCLVNGVSTTFTTLGQTVPGGSDPLVDLTGLPNPSNYVFKYTLTNACGSSNKNLTVNIDCENCTTKTVNTVMTTTTCSHAISVLHPITFTANNAQWVATANSSITKLTALVRLSGTCNANIDATKTIDYTAWVTQTTTVPMSGEDRMTSIKVWNSSTNSATVIPLPALSYSSGCGGTIPAPIANKTKMYGTLGNQTPSQTATFIRSHLMNAICATFPGINASNMDFKVDVALTNGVYTLKITSRLKHLPSTTWISLPITNGDLVYTASGSSYSTTVVNQLSIPVQSGVEGFGFKAYNTCGKQLVATYDPNLPVPLDPALSTASNFVFINSSQPITPVTNSYTLLSTTCKQFDFNTTISPACTGTPTYSYKVNGVTIAETTASFSKKPYTDAICNPFNPGVTTPQIFKTLVTCDGCDYDKDTITLCP